VQVQRAAQVDRDDPIPELRRGLHELHRDIPTGVVDQDVDATALDVDLPDGHGNGRMVGDVQRTQDQLVGEFLELAAQLLQARSVQVQSHDGGAFLTEPAHERTTDAARGAGDHGYFSLQSTHVHGS
jgi:hypothetical protein